MEKEKRIVLSNTNPINVKKVGKTIPEGETVSITGKPVFGYRTENGDIRWFSTKEIKKSDRDVFYEENGKLIRLWMRGIELETGYILNWKNAFND